jgi:UDP-glucose 4-epimerase
MASHGVKTLIYSSTCATYGEPEKMPIIETTPQVFTFKLSSRSAVFLKDYERNASW